MTTTDYDNLTRSVKEVFNDYQDNGTEISLVELLGVLECVKADYIYSIATSNNPIES